MHSNWRDNLAVVPKVLEHTSSKKGLHIIHIDTVVCVYTLHIRVFIKFQFSLSLNLFLNLCCSVQSSGFTLPASVWRRSRRASGTVRVACWNERRSSRRRQCLLLLNIDRCRPSNHYIVILTVWRPLLPCGYSYKASCARPGWAIVCNFWHPGTLTLRAERQTVQMSKNYNWWLNPVWHRMFHSCICMATVGVKRLTIVVETCELCC